MYTLMAVFVIVACSTISICVNAKRDDMDDTGKRYEVPIYSTSISRATTRVILDFYVEYSSTLSITKSSTDLNNWDQSDFISEVLYHTGESICITNEEYMSVSNVRLRFFNAMFINGYTAFR